MTAGGRRFVLDRSWRRPHDSDVVIAGSPLRLFRLTEAGRMVVSAIEKGVGPLPDGHERLTDRLLDAGAIHPAPPRQRNGEYSRSDVTVVIPTHQPDHERLSSLVAACGPVARVIVVDDASPQAVGPVNGAEVVRRERNGGPGAAREDGRAAAATRLVAFVDDDVAVTPGWVDGLLPHFDDARVGLVAPRVRSTSDASALATYDAERSPLDLGPAPGRIRSGTRISYVPAAVIVVRREALESVDGFDPTLRFGEDVDLVWRLDEQGWRCRYEPGVVVEHAPRRHLADWLRQRYQYGSSAAPLALRHPGALAPVRMNGWSLGVWGLIATGHPLAAVGIGVGTTAALVRKLPDVPGGGGEALRLAGLGHLYAGRQLASAATREWWPLALALALVSRRARRVFVAAATVPPLIDYWSNRGSVHGPRDLARTMALRLLDDMAYGTGVWHGVWRHRTAAPLLPAVSAFPGRPGLSATGRGAQRPGRIGGRLRPSHRTR